MGRTWIATATAWAASEGEWGRSASWRSCAMRCGTAHAAAAGAVARATNAERCVRRLATSPCAGLDDHDLGRARQGAIVTDDLGSYETAPDRLGLGDLGRLDAYDRCFRRDWTRRATLQATWRRLPGRIPRRAVRLAAALRTAREAKISASPSRWQLVYPQRPSVSVPPPCIVMDDATAYWRLAVGDSLWALVRRPGEMAVGQGRQIHIQRSGCIAVDHRAGGRFERRLKVLRGLDDNQSLRG